MWCILLVDLVAGWPLPTIGYDKDISIWHQTICNRMRSQITTSHITLHCIVTSKVMLSENVRWALSQQWSIRGWMWGRLPITIVPKIAASSWIDSSQTHKSFPINTKNHYVRVRNISIWSCMDNDSDAFCANNARAIYSIRAGTRKLKAPWQSFYHHLLRGW